MILLDTTTRSLRFNANGNAATYPYVVCYSDMTTTTFVPGATDGVTTAITTNTLLSAPGSSTVRQLEYMAICNNTASPSQTQMLIEYNDNGTIYPLIKFFLAPGECLEYTVQDGWQVRTLAGIKKSTLTYANPKTSGQFLLPFRPCANLTDVTAAVSVNAPLIVYLGQAAYSSGQVKVQYRVTTLASTITYAELGLYVTPRLFIPANTTGTTNGTAPAFPLKLVGTANCAAVWNTTGIKTTNVPSVNTGSGINAGDHLFLSFNYSGSVSPVFRATLIDNLYTHLTLSSTTGWRPSTTAIPIADIIVTGNAAGSAFPWVAGTLT